MKIVSKTNQNILMRVMRSSRKRVTVTVCTFRLTVQTVPPQIVRYLTTYRYPKSARRLATGKLIHPFQTTDRNDLAPAQHLAR